MKWSLFTMMKRSPKNTKRLTRRDLDALRLIAAPGLRKSATLKAARKLETFGLVKVEVLTASAQKASAWTASLTEVGRTLLRADAIL